MERPTVQRARQCRIWHHILFILIGAYCMVHELGARHRERKGDADILRPDACAGSVSARFRTREKYSVTEAAFRKFGKPFFGAF
jgi:hypothetical protein